MEVGGYCVVCEFKNKGFRVRACSVDSNSLSLAPNPSP